MFDVHYTFVIKKITQTIHKCDMENDMDNFMLIQGDWKVAQNGITLEWNI